MRSRQVVWMILLWMFFVFDGNPLFFTFFVCSLSSKVCGESSSRFWRLESVELHWFVIWWCFRTFELDSRKLLDLGRWSGWFSFECSPILGLKFLKALRLDSCRVFSLLNPGPFKCLRKASIYTSLEVGEQHLAESDWWHMSQPIGPLMSSFTHAGLLMSSLTRVRLLVSSLTRTLMRDWFLHDT